MGANPTQAVGVVLFIVAFGLFSGAAAGGGILTLILGLLALAGSIAVFLKAKPLEHKES